MAAIEVETVPAGGDDHGVGAEPTVHDHLEMALELAAEQEMSTSELMGIFFYYAHSIAESYRQDVIDEQEAEGRALSP